MHQACWGVATAATIELRIGVSGTVEAVSVRDLSGVAEDKHACVVSWLSEAFGSARYEPPGAPCVHVVQFKMALKS